MNDKDYIRKAVELADEWVTYDTTFLGGCYFAQHSYDKVPQPVLDALAAQLVRQVDALPAESGVDVFPQQSIIYEASGNEAFVYVGDDRTMNTIKAIVDSGVLT